MSDCDERETINVDHSAVNLFAKLTKASTNFSLMIKVLYIKDVTTSFFPLSL